MSSWHVHLLMGDWECQQRIRKRGALLGNGGPRVQGGKALCSRQIDIGSVRQNWHLGFPCLPFYASFLLPTPGHCRCSIDTCGIKPDGLYILVFFNYFLLHQNNVY